MNQTPPSTPRLSQRFILIVPALALLYPLGLWLLWKKPTTRTPAKVVLSILSLPAFAFFVLLLLRPYWDFSGSMALGGFRLDFDKGAARDDLVRSHRDRQKAVSSTAPHSAPVTGSWTDFRGPHRDGITDSTNISLDWTAHPPKEIYRQPIGAGYAGFVIADGRAYTLEQRRDKEAVVCYEFLSGRETWAFEYRASFEEVLGGDGPRATPTLALGRLYALGAVGHLNCLDPATGKLLWAGNILTDFGEENLYWGLSSAPLIMDDLVILCTSGKGGPGVIAYDATTGKLRWKSATGEQCYASLMDVTLAGKRQILNFADAAIQGIDFADGKMLWSYPWEMSGGPSCAQPIIVGPDRLFVSSGYGKGCALLSIKTASGNASPPFIAESLWSNSHMKNKFASSVLHRDAIYGLDEGILCCLDLATGVRKWKGGKYGHGSLLLAGDHLLILGEQGELALVPADPAAFHETARIQIFTGRTWNNFSVVGGILLARNHKEMAAYDLCLTPGKPAAPPLTGTPR